jgi:hypothetical protein
MVTPTLDRDLLANVRPDRETLVVIGLLVNSQLAIMLGYLLVSDAIITEPRYLIYPWLWINATVLAVWKTEPPQASTATRRLGVVLAGGYFLLLAVAAGIVGPTGGFLATLTGTAGPATGATGLSLHWLPPGTGPALVFQGTVLRAALFPYEVLGYAGLAYLVYAGVLETAGSTLSGVIGLFSCVSCAWPVVGGAVAAIFGSGSAIAVAASTWPQDISTIVFLSAVIFLYWRPSW